VKCGLPGEPADYMLNGNFTFNILQGFHGKKGHMLSDLIGLTITMAGISKRVN